MARERGLTSLPAECLLIVDAGPYTFDVRERHGGACGGDTNTAPRLFTARLDPATGAVLSTAGVTERGEVGMDTVRRATRAAPAGRPANGRPRGAGRGAER